MGYNLESLYQARFDSTKISRQQEIWEVLCTDYFQHLIPLNAHVLDIGCGHGSFINHIKASRKIGIDLNPAVRTHLRPDVSFYAANVLDFDFSLLGQIDSVFLSNFLEHLKSKDELEALLDKIYAFLPPGGKVIIMGPNIKYLAGAYWDFYDHHLPLTHHSLSEVLRLKGFQVESCIDRFLPYTTLGKLPTHPLLVKFYLKLAWTWKIFGKQFLLTARR